MNIVEPPSDLAPAGQRPEGHNADPASLSSSIVFFWYKKPSNDSWIPLTIPIIMEYLAEKNYWVGLMSII
jgi:hypothetical protein